MTKIIDNLNIETKTKIIHEIDALKSCAEFNNIQKVVAIEIKVSKIKKILDNETKLTEEEKEVFKEFLKQSILEVVNGYQENVGKNVWEKFEHKKLEKYITSILRGYWLDEQRFLMRGTQQLYKEFKERVKEGTKPSSLKGQNKFLQYKEQVQDLFWMLDEPQRLLKEIGNGKLNETIVEVIEKMETDARTHFEANKKSMEKPWGKEALKEEVEQKSQKLEENRIEIGEYKLEIARLKRELQEKSEKLEEVIMENREQKIQIDQLKEKSLVNNLSKKRKRENEVEQKRKKRIELQQPAREKEVEKLIASIEISKKQTL